MACSRPFQKNVNGKTVKIPCGWCMACRIDKRNEWADRIMFECIGRRNTFITLTYDDEHLPANGSLEQYELKKFNERFRILLKRKYNYKDWKYFYTGEYGDSFGRPHYHGILMGIDSFKFADDLEREWGKGRIRAEPAQSGAIRYVLKYIEKQQHKEKAKELYDDNGIERPFAVMSKGIGRKWLEEHREEIESLNGYKYKGSIRPLPQYYRNLMRIGEESNPKKKIEKMRKNGYDDWDEYEKAIGIMRERHIIKELRNNCIPIDERYLINYRPKQEYMNIAKKLTEGLDLKEIPTENEKYTYDLFGGLE